MSTNIEKIKQAWGSGKPVYLEAYGHWPEWSKRKHYSDLHYHNGWWSFFDLEEHTRYVFSNASLLKVRSE